MTRTVDERLNDILMAISRARIADERLTRAESQNDQAGVQLAFDSILHNLFVVGEAVKSLPAELLTGDPGVPWSQIAAMRDVIGHHYHRVVPAIIHRTVEVDLVPLASAVERLRTQL